MSKNIQYASNRIQKNLRERGWLTGNTIYLFKKISIEEVEGVLDVLIDSTEDLEIKRNLSILRGSTKILTDRKIMLAAICVIWKKQVTVDIRKLSNCRGYY